jgi:hypothetical protein
VNNQLGPDLSAEAQRLILEARGLDEPTSEDRQRVKARWLASIAVGAGASSFSEAAHAATTTGAGWGFKAAGFALIVAASAAGVFALLPTNGSRQSAPSGTAARELPAQPQAELAASSPALPEVKTLPPSELDDGTRPLSMPAAPPLEEQVRENATAEAVAVPTPEAEVGVARRAVPKVTALPRTVALLPAPSGVESPIGTASPASEPSNVPSARNATQLSEELAALSEIRRTVQAGGAARAVQLLLDYEIRFARPILGMEAAALRVDALCRAGQRDAARASAEAFQSAWPGSPLEQRVSAACP